METLQESETAWLDLDVSASKTTDATSISLHDADTSLGHDETPQDFSCDSLHDADSSLKVLETEKCEPDCAPPDLSARRDEEILWIISINCCAKKCMRQLSVEDIRYAEAKKKAGKRNYFLEYLHQHSSSDDSNELQTEFYVKGKIVCREAWLLAHNLNKETFRRIWGKFKDGANVLEHGNKGRKSITSKTADCIAWLQFFVSCVGDHQPDNGGIHLPTCFTKSDIYKKMLEENKALSQPTVSLSHFYGLWERNFLHVTIPKENRFTKCTDCTKYKQEKEKTVDKARRAEIDHLLKLHLDLVWQERRVYYLHRYKARRYPSKYVANIADGMDQHTTNVPSVRRITKAMSALTTVGTHLVGSIIHNGQAQNGKEIYGSFDYYQYPHDSNLTMTVLLEVLVRWSEEFDLPPILYLQFDNCVRENKNRYMFALLALLVEEKIFEKIRVNFLPVGHTHEDIDAFFGVYSKHLDKLDVYTVTELLKALETCMKNPTPKPYMLKMVYDIKSWISDYCEELHEHTVPKGFKFTLNEDGKAVMLYRNWSHEPWKEPIAMLKSLPSGKPNTVTPSLHKLDMEGLKRDIPTKYPKNMPLKASEEWESWLANTEFNLLSVPDNYTWPVDKLKNTSRTVLASNAELPHELLELREKEIQPITEVNNN